MLGVGRRGYDLNKWLVFVEVAVNPLQPFLPLFSGGELTAKGCVAGSQYASGHWHQVGDEGYPGRLVRLEQPELLDNLRQVAVPV